ncbi:glycosyltransferase family 4 protein [Azonexus sp.]|uniref:glycosyltransferase family 4 protein n=1 Tax=Azonexus sp. TaxID=1872668 RepID=UPI0035B3B1AB
MHVLILASYAPSLVNFRGPLIASLFAAGHRVTVGAPDISPQRAVLEALGAGIMETPLLRTGLNPFADLAYLSALRRVIHETRPDCVLTYTIKPNIWGAFAAHRERVPVVAMVTGLGYAFTQGAASAGVKTRLSRALARALYRRATDRNRCVIFQNPDDRDDFLAAGCLTDRGKVRMVNGSGVDMAHYTPVPLPQAPVFLMISRILGNKGVREYAWAAAAVRATHPQARFRLVGYIDEGPDGIPRAELDRWIAAGLDYLGPLEDVRPAIAQASVYVLPSYREGTPRSVLEAMAMGRPILTSDAPGCRETVVPGRNGWLVPPRDSEALAERMRWMIDNPAEWQRMGAESLTLAAAKYAVEKVNADMIAHLELMRLE